MADDVDARLIEPFLGAAHADVGLRDLEVQTRPLRGGLVSADVAVASTRFRDGEGRMRRRRFVAKRLEGMAVREATVYERLLNAGLAEELAPRLLGVHRGRDASTLFIEAVRPMRRWPWNDEMLARHVLERLAALHAGGCVVG